MGRNEDMAPEAEDRGDQVRHLIRQADKAVLSTLLVREERKPYGSLVLVAATHEGSPLLLLSDLAQHTRNAREDSRVALLCDGTGDQDDPLAGARASVLGRLVEDPDPGHRERFLRRHPGARGYADFTDFRCYRIEVEFAHLIAGFGAIVRVPADEILIPSLPALVEAEPAILEEENARRSDEPGSRTGRTALPPRLLTGLDPDGVDFRAGKAVTRMPFPRRAITLDDLRKMTSRLGARDDPSSRG